MSPRKQTMGSQGEKKSARDRIGREVIFVDKPAPADKRSFVRRNLDRIMPLATVAGVIVAIFTLFALRRQANETEKTNVLMRYNDARDLLLKNEYDSTHIYIISFCLSTLHDIAKSYSSYRENIHDIFCVYLSKHAEALHNIDNKRTLDNCSQIVQNLIYYLFKSNVYNYKNNYSELSNINLTNCDFTGLTLSNCNFKNGTLTNCMFNRGTLTDCYFNGTSLDSCEFNGGTLTKCHFNGNTSSLTNCDFKKVGISYESNNGRIIKIIPPHNCDLRSCDFSEATLTNCDLGGAVLKDTTNLFKETKRNGTTKLPSGAKIN